MYSGVVGCALALFFNSLVFSCNNPELSNTRILSEEKASVPLAPAPQPDNLLVTGQSVGRATIGMTLTELRNAYPDCTFEERPVHEYGIDGESPGLLLRKNGQPFLFAWTNDGEQKVKGLVALSEELHTRQGYQPGMELQQVEQLCAGCEIGLDMLDPRIEFIMVPGTEIRLEFLTSDSTRIGRYDFHEPEPRSAILMHKGRASRLSIIAGPDMQ